MMRARCRKCVLAQERFLADTRVVALRFLVGADLAVDFVAARFVVVVFFAGSVVALFADRDVVFDALFDVLFDALLRGADVPDDRPRDVVTCLAEEPTPPVLLFDRPLAGFATYVAAS